jgi:hypothetical protein
MTKAAPPLAALLLFACGGTSAPEPAPAPAQPPIARLRLPRLGAPGASLLVSAADSQSPGGELSHFRFTFGDGASQLDSGAPLVRHGWAAEGVFAVSLQVEDLQGRRDRVDATIAIRASPPPCATDADCDAGDLCVESNCTTEVESDRPAEGGTARGPVGGESGP